MIVTNFNYQKLAKIAADIDGQRYRYFYRNQAITTLLFDLQHSLEDAERKLNQSRFAAQKELAQKEYHRLLNIIDDLKIEYELNKGKIEMIKSEYESAVDNSLNETL